VSETLVASLKPFEVEREDLFLW